MNNTATIEPSPVSSDVLFQQILDGIDEVQARMKTIRELADRLAHAAGQETTQDGTT